MDVNNVLGNWEDISEISDDSRQCSEASDSSEEEEEEVESSEEKDACDSWNEVPGKYSIVSSMGDRCTTTSSFT